MSEIGPGYREAVAYNDALAARYDTETAKEGWAAINRRVTDTLMAINPGAVGSMLDLGAGTGQTIEAVLSVVSPEDIVAVDLSSKMLEKLKSKTFGQAVETITGSIESFAGTNTRDFDLMTAIGSMEFVQNLPTQLRLLSSFLKPGGILAFTYIPRNAGETSSKQFSVPSIGGGFTEYYWPHNDVIDAVMDSGLHIIRAEVFPAYARGNEQVVYEFIAAQKIS
ncbi:MAG: bacillithiol biosynthesis cysteine-adding enzyme BshC [Candidatus Saccharibacteria bacterium]|nr:bacillithiol biosynthesis cysteine-adding enzyme BshC [Candidatus Saccharibacteria bacterium]